MPVKCVALSSNSIEDDGAFEFARTLERNSTLEELILGSEITILLIPCRNGPILFHRQTDEETRVEFGFIIGDWRLFFTGFSFMCWGYPHAGNGIGNAGARALARGLERNSRLCVLGLKSALPSLEAHENHTPLKFSTLGVVQCPGGSYCPWFCVAVGVQLFTR